MKQKTGNRNKGHRLFSLRTNRSSNAFTLVEMLVVVGILAILMGSAFSGIGQARNQARIARANAEVRELINAWLSYEAASDKELPIDGDLFAEAGNLKELLGENDSKIVYLNAQMVGNAFRDPWGTPYKFHLVSDKGQDGVTEQFGATVTFPNRQRVPR